MQTDPSYGVSANRQGKQERREFLFGNIDPYRMVANGKFQQNFEIPKQQWRADPYDNQEGELETTDRGSLRYEMIRTHTTLSCEDITE